MAIARRVHHRDIPNRIASVALTEGEAVYLDSNAKLAKAKADAIGTQALGLVSRTVTSDQVTTGGEAAKANIVREGILDGYTGLTPMTEYYLSEATAGAITSTIPADGNFIQRIGFAISTTEIYFDFSMGDRPLKKQAAATSLRTSV